MKYKFGYLNGNTETDPLVQPKAPKSVQHRCLQLQTSAFVIPCYINAWNCRAKCAELSVYVARGERKQEEHECPLSQTGLPGFLEFLKLLASGDGTCLLTHRMKRIGREEREARERKRERERMPGSGIGPYVRPVSDLFQTPAKGSSHSSAAARGPWR